MDEAKELGEHMPSAGRRVRNKNTGRVGVELTPYGWPRYEIRWVLWDGDADPTVCGIRVLTDEADQSGSDGGSDG